MGGCRAGGGTILDGCEVGQRLDGGGWQLGRDGGGSVGRTRLVVAEAPEPEEAVVRGGASLGPSAAPFFSLRGHMFIERA